MEILKKSNNTKPVSAVLFDFDGTVSTLRFGWEAVMKPLMLEMITGKTGIEYDAALEKEVDDYINESTGIQTIHQMKWQAEYFAMNFLMKFVKSTLAIKLQLPITSINDR